MPYSISWFVENRAVLVTLTDAVTVEEMMEYGSVLHDDYLEKGQAPIHLVVDLNHMTGFPTQVMAVKRASQAYLNHPALGWAIFVGIHNPLLSFVANTVSQTLRIKSQQAKTLEEALEKLKRIDPQLKDAST